MMKYLLAFCFVAFSLLLNAQTMTEICPINISEECPSAEIYVKDGTPVDLKEVIGDHPTVLVVYRGGWCPYCTRHLAAIQEVKKEIDAAGFQIVALTPDNFSKLDSSFASIEGGLDYWIYSDKDANAIKALGLAWKVDDPTYTKYVEKYHLDLEEWSGEKHHLLPVPAIIVFYKGTIRYHHIDPKYSQRLDPQVLLAMLNSLTE